MSRALSRPGRVALWSRLAGPVGHLPHRRLRRHAPRHRSHPPGRETQHFNPSGRQRHALCPVCTGSLVTFPPCSGRTARVPPGRDIQMAAAYADPGTSVSIGQPGGRCFGGPGVAPARPRQPRSACHHHARCGDGGRDATRPFGGNSLRSADQLPALAVPEAGDGGVREGRAAWAASLTDRDAVLCGRAADAVMGRDRIGPGYRRGQDHSLRRASRERTPRPPDHASRCPGKAVDSVQFVWGARDDHGPGQASISAFTADRNRPAIAPWPHSTSSLRGGIRQNER